MSFIVEDGTGLVDAEVYISLTDANEYHLKLDNLAWLNASEDTRWAALRKATVFLEDTYVWNGELATTTQALSFPRTGVYNSNGQDVSNVVPKDVLDSCCDLALNALSGALVKEVSKSDYEQRKKVGPIEVEYFENYFSIGREFPAINKKLSSLYVSSTSGTSTVKLVRV